VDDAADQHVRRPRQLPLLALPFFILAGEIMGQGGIAKPRDRLGRALTGSVRARCRSPRSPHPSSLARCRTPRSALSRRSAVSSTRRSRAARYSDRFTVSLIASSGAIAVVIPPSIAMILYSMSAQQSAIALFTAGILPSLLIGFVDAVYVVFYSRSRNVAVARRRPGRRSGRPPKEAGWALGHAGRHLRGIYGGIFTPDRGRRVSPRSTRSW